MSGLMQPMLGAVARAARPRRQLLEACACSCRLPAQASSSASTSASASSTWPSVRASLQQRGLSTSSAAREEAAGTEAAGTRSTARDGPDAKPGYGVFYNPYQKRVEPPSHKVHVQASSNNTIITVTTPEGNPLFGSSGGTAGFKKAARSGYEAGYRASFQAFREIEARRNEWGIEGLEVVFKGFGQGREAFYRALVATEGSQVRALVRRMTDATKIKIGGVRPKKRRML